MREYASHYSKYSVWNSSMHPHQWMTPTYQVSSHYGLEIDTVTSSPDSSRLQYQRFLNPCYPTSINSQYFISPGDCPSMLPWTSRMLTFHKMRILNPSFPSLAILAIRTIQTTHPFIPLIVERTPFYNDHPVGHRPVTFPTTLGYSNHQMNSGCGLFYHSLVQSSQQSPSHTYQNLGGSSSNQPIQSSDDLKNSLEGRMMEFKKRHSFTSNQILALEKEFSINEYPTSIRYTVMAQDLDLTKKQIKIWFANRRVRRKRESTKLEAETSMEHCIRTNSTATIFPNAVDSYQFFISSARPKF